MTSRSEWVPPGWIHLSYNSLLNRGRRVDFEIYGATSGRKYLFILDETGTPDGRLSAGDVITLVFDPVGFRFNLGWRFTFSGPDGESPRLPEPGDVFRLEVSKPYSSLDTITFGTPRDAL